ncbi:MAG: hypothetical protein MJZ16_05080 [Bacteroidales bacterium]|nr:hypothetical protein [Bacteroidales bacterium]
MSEAKWKFSDIGRFLKESIIAIIKGEFLLRINCAKYFIHIIWTFFLLFCAIWISLSVEETLTKVEQNKKELSDMDIYRAQKTVEIVRLNRMTTVQEMLQEQGSKVTMPVNPPTVINNK